MMTLVETVTLTSAASSIEFTSIPQDGVDLLLKVSTRTGRAASTDSLGIEINGTTVNYAHIRLFGTGVGTGSSSATTTTMMTSVGNNATSNTFGNAQLYFSNYSSSVAKSISAESVSEDNTSTANQDIRAILWNNSSAITSLKIISVTASNFLSGSTASLYKIS